jgi:hypothetical protein
MVSFRRSWDISKKIVFFFGWAGNTRFQSNSGVFVQDEDDERFPT